MRSCELKAILLSLLMILMTAVGVAAGERTPAGYLVSLKLTGEDATAKTVVMRDGVELAGKLMMPLYDGDAVFVRDPQSSIGVELGDATTVTLGQGLARYQLKGEIDTGDGAFGILSAIGGVFSGGAEPAPENMAAKGASIKMPMAEHGANMILAGRQNLWLAWEGGKAPFSVSMPSDGGETQLMKDVQQQSVSVPITAVTGKKFTVILRDNEGQKLQLRFRRTAALPDGLPVSGTSQASLLAKAAWLTSQKGWSIEAAQMLHESGTDAAAALRDRIVSGWTYEP